MPTNSYTSPGNYSWTAPFACKNVTATVIGGGGAGYRDCDGDDQGGGGGGGGFARATRLVPAGTVLSIKVGAGGNNPSCNSRSGGNGDTSRITGGVLTVRATGGECGYDDSGGGSAGGADAGDTTRSGQRGEDDDQGGKGGGAGNASGNSGRCSGSRAGGRGTSLNGSSGSCSGGKNGGNYGGGGGGNNDGESSGSGAKGAARIEWDYYAPSITSFTVGNQYSTGGTPRDDVIMSWSTTYADNISINQGVGSGLPAADSRTINTGLQSNADGTSPAQKTYTLTASGPGGTVTATATANVKNDNTPSNSWNTSFINLEPNTQYQLNLGTLSGVDMPTYISTSGSGNRVGGNGGYASARYFNNGNVVNLETTTLPFNTDISGLSSTATYGKTNSKTVTVSHPGGSFNVTITTRAPVIKENFNYSDNKDNYPYEDIDLIANSPTEYIVSASQVMDDIEIPMEMKLSNANTQIRVNGGSWQNVRST